MLGHTCHNLPRRRRRCVPDVERRPASVQIADHYRDRILAGELSPGDRLPSAADLAAQWHVAKQTVTRAVGRLQVEGAVYTTPRGTFVASDDRIIRSPRPIRHGKGERVKLDEVGIVLAPNYVAELLDLEPGAMVIRRQEVTTLRGKPQMLSVDWIATGNVMAEAELLGPLGPDGPAAVIATVTGRRVTHAQDHIEGREADAREAHALKIPVGSAILAGAHVWSDQEGVILYGEWVMPPKRVVSYSYEVAE
jgi:GntR family transcriptional regulator